MEELALVGIGITAVLYVFRLSEYFENEVKKARDRLKELRKYQYIRNDTISKAIKAQERVRKCYGGEFQRSILVWIPAFILFLTFSGFLRLSFPLSLIIRLLWWITLSFSTMIIFYIGGIRGISIYKTIKGNMERKQRFIVVILILVIILIDLGFPLLFFLYCPYLACWIFYFIALLIPSIGAGIGMWDRPIARYHEVIWKYEE